MIFTLRPITPRQAMDGMAADIVVVIVAGLKLKMVVLGLVSLQVGYS